MQLEDVKDFFEKHGDFIFKTNLFCLNNLPDSCDTSASDVHLAFQRTFLNVLKDPATKDELERQEQIYQQQLDNTLQKNRTEDQGLGLCRISEEYFRELLHVNTFKGVPEDIQQHILSCPECSGKFFNYMNTFCLPLTEERTEFIENMTAQLVRQFSLAGEKIYCRDVKEFLPLLVDPGLEIEIPTPVTVHIENCSACTKDLWRLLKLNLKPKQLAGLSSFYSAGIFEKSEECLCIHELFFLIGEFRFDKVPIKYLEHICLCKSCQEQLRAERTVQIMAMTNEAGNQKDRHCELVGACDLFDYCLPFALDTSDPESRVFRGPFIRHLVNCRICLTKLHELSGLLYSIAWRADSGLITCYRVKESRRNVELFTSYDIFDKADDSGRSNRQPAATIDCQKVTQYLPFFGDPVEQIALPAIADAHIKGCPLCRRDIATIRSWNLDYRKLARLANFLAKPTFDQSDECVSVQEKRESIIELFTQMRFENSNAETLKHICLCRSCRNLLYEVRFTNRPKIPVSDQPAAFLCKNIAPVDLFDYVFPYGIDPAHDEMAKFRPFLAKHLAKCPVCLEKMRQIHNSIYSMAERGRFEIPEEFKTVRPTQYRRSIIDNMRKVNAIEELAGASSDALLANLLKTQNPVEDYPGWGIEIEITGELTTDDDPFPAEKQGSHGLDDKYSDHPVKVQAESEAEAVTGVIKFPQKVRERVAAVKWPRVVRPGALLKYAAVIAISVVIGSFLINPPTAVAKSYNQAVDAVRKIGNVCIRRYKPGQTEPAQTEWISKTLNVHLFKLNDRIVLRNLSSKVKWTKTLTTGLITTLPISVEKLIVFKKELSSTFGLMPFEDLTDVPGTQWYLADEDTYSGEEVYELTWSETKGDATRHYQWRYFFADPGSDVPSRVERYQKRTSKDVYELREYYEVTEYQNDMEIKALIESIFGTPVIPVEVEEPSF